MSAVEVAAVRPFERKFPPVVGVAMLALALAVTGGVILAGQAQEHPSVTTPGVLEVGAIVLELAAFVMLARIRPFAWDRFRLVFAWALVAYVIQGGMIEWAFAKYHTPARPLIALTLGIVVFATAVPLMIAFTVARYQAVPTSA
jgi:hypothetical protein